MPDDAVSRRIDDLPDRWDGFAHLVRAGMGLSAFGAQVMNLPPDYETRSHDETPTGQEELYVALSGSGAVVVERDGAEERLTLDPDHMVACQPPVTRKLASGPDGLRVLCIGGAPGKPYEVQDWTEPESGG